jgi:hypothetical protein
MVTTATSTTAGKLGRRLASGRAFNVGRQRIASTPGGLSSRDQSASQNSDDQRCHSRPNQQPRVIQQAKSSVPRSDARTHRDLSAAGCASGAIKARIHAGHRGFARPRGPTRCSVRLPAAAAVSGTTPLSSNSGVPAVISVPATRSPFVHASERHRAQLSDARPGRHTEAARAGHPPSRQQTAAKAPLVSSRSADQPPWLPSSARPVRGATAAHASDGRARQPRCVGSFGALSYGGRDGEHQVTANAGPA